MRGPLLAFLATLLVIVGWAVDNVAAGLVGAGLALVSVSISLGDLVNRAEADQSAAIRRYIARNENNGEP